MTYLLDDFTDADVVARRWRVFSDRVLGGVSVARAEVATVAGAARFGGLQLTVCGVPGSYFVCTCVPPTRDLHGSTTQLHCR